MRDDLSGLQQRIVELEKQNACLANERDKLVEHCIFVPDWSDGTVRWVFTGDFDKVPFSAMVKTPSHDEAVASVRQSAGLDPTTRHSDREDIVGTLLGRLKKMEENAKGFGGLVRERLAHHRENLALWEDGTLTPTEPDGDERQLAQERLKAAIHELEHLLEATR